MAEVDDGVGGRRYPEHSHAWVLWKRVWGIKREEGSCLRGMETLWWLKMTKVEEQKLQADKNQ